MLVKILGAVAAVLGALAVAIALQPSSYTVARKQTIAAPQADVFAMINDFHKWEAWSPWAKLDPKMKTTYEGAAAGNGAVYKWVGDSKVGEGVMTVTESQPNERVKIKLDFLAPFASSSMTEFTVKPDGDKVTVEWSMAGNSDFMSKAYSLFAGGMDKAIGPDFEKGLAQMKAAAEGAKK